MTQLVDDQELSRLLRAGAYNQPANPVFTTGLWYVRLGQALFGAQSKTGKLSGPFASLPVPLQEQALRSVFALPDEVGLVSLRDLAPRIGQLRGRHRLNLLGAEVLAAAIELDAEVVLSSPAPMLEAALHSEGCALRCLYT